MLKAIKIRIYPSDEQKQYLSKLLGCCRFVYNKMLSYKQSEYKDNNNSISGSDLINRIVSLKDEFPFLKDVHSKVLQQSVRDLNTAYENFFKNKSGYPNYKSKRDNKQSCRFQKDAFIGIRGNRIDLIKSLKDIRFNCSRRDLKYLNRHQDLVHNLTLTKVCSGKYYISVLIDYRPEIKQNTGSVIGLDLGLKDFAVDSNGNRYDNKHFYTKQERKLKRLNRQFAKKKMVKTGNQVFSAKYNKMVDETRSSHNKEKVRIKIAKLNEKIAFQRYDYIQKLTTQLVNENQVICIENLNVKGMMRNHKLAKQVQDVSWSTFVNILEYKCKIYNRTLIKIDRFFPSSKKCNHCGYINKELKLSDRTWICPDCGSVIDRDYNAAVNILEEGLKIYRAGLARI